MNEAQRQYKKQLQRILRLKVTKQIKTQMLYSFHQVLKQHCKIQSIVFNQSFNQISIVKGSQKPLQIQSTKFSQSLSIDNVTLITQRDIQELQQQILAKKILKISKYEEVETLEQQLYQIQDSVQCKRKYHQHLRKSIDKKMIDIQQQKQKSLNHIEIKSYSCGKDKYKHNRSFSDYLKSWWA